MKEGHRRFTVVPGIEDDAPEEPEHISTEDQKEMNTALVGLGFKLDSSGNVLKQPEYIWYDPNDGGRKGRVVGTRMDRMVAGMPAIEFEIQKPVGNRSETEKRKVLMPITSQFVRPYTGQDKEKENLV